MNKYQEAFENMFPPKEFEHIFPQFAGLMKMMEFRRKDYMDLKELVEKATPKKPKKTEAMGEHYYACPRCGSLIEEEYHVKNILKSPSKDILPKGCEICLQAIDWSDGE